jgi:MFS family permease
MASKDPYAALRHRPFLFLISGTMIITAAILIQEVVLGYELYKLTRSPKTLAYLGLAEALPYISLAMFGGYLADQMNKKRIVLMAMSVVLLGSVALIFLTQNTWRIQYFGGSLWPIYAVLVVISFARGISTPAGSAMKAFLVPADIYSNAASWSSTFWQTGAIVGPALGGILYAVIGLQATLGVVVGLTLLFLLLISLIPAPPVVKLETRPNVWQSIQEGFSFVFQNKILFYSISLDLVAVLFGGVMAILPIFAMDILQVGPEGLGVLRAAPSVGAVVTVILTAYFPPTRRAWRNMLIAVAGFGISTLVFALSDHFWLSVLMLFLTGAFDSISVVIRQTILQVVPPDHIRGRVGAVNSVFVSASNELGAFESGMAAAWLGTVRSVLAGAGVTMLVVAWVWAKTKDLLDTRLE